MNLEDYRDELDEIDKNILILLKNRYDLSKKIGKLKAEKNMPIFNQERESEIIKKVTNFCEDYKIEFEKIYKIILSDSKALQSEQKKLE